MDQQNDTPALPIEAPTTQPEMQPAIGDYELDPAFAGLVHEELARVPVKRRVAADAAIRAHLASGFVGTHVQHATKWRDVIRPFQSNHTTPSPRGATP